MNRIANRAAGRLSHFRRARGAGLVLIVVGLLLSGGIYTLVAPAQAQRTETDQELVEQGRDLFLVGCAFCHGKNGEGIKSVRGQLIGPSLVGVGAASTHFQVGTGRMPLAQPGAQAVRKPPQYDEEETLAMSAYVASLGPGPAIPDPADYSLDGLSEKEKEEAISRGGQIFFTNCTACHNFAGAGGAMPRGGFAPALRGVEPVHVYEALLTGPQTMPTFSNGNLSPEDKRDVIAYLQSIEETPEYGGFGLDATGPVGEGLAAWVLGIGALVAFAVWIAAHTARSSKKKVQP
ncbi:MAG: cytochrome bc1 complex diheme cytochrome c subunit [Nocardioides sp.]